MLDFVLESEVKEKWKRELIEVFSLKMEGFCTAEIHVWSNFFSDWGKIFYPTTTTCRAERRKMISKLWILFEFCRAAWGKSYKRTDRKNDYFWFSDWKMKTRFQWLWFDMQRYHAGTKDKISWKNPIGLGVVFIKRA